MPYAHIARAVFNRPWYLEERTFAIMVDLVTRRLAGDPLDAETIRANLAAAAAANGPRAGAPATGPVGHVPIYGVIMQRASLMSDMSGGTSVEQAARLFRRHMADPEIGSVLLEFDSPGGEVSGIEEFAAEIREARARAIKPIVGLANAMMLSAAYYLGAQADEIVASPSSVVGSIGVVFKHQEASRALDTAGITTTVIRQPERKAEANTVEPLTDDARALLQQEVDDYYGQFVAAVARGRGVSQAAVRAGYGQGTSLTAKRALDAGLVDRIDTLEGTVSRMTAGKIVMRGARAEAEEPLPVITSASDSGGAFSKPDRRAAEIALARARR